MLCVPVNTTDTVNAISTTPSMVGIGASTRDLDDDLKLFYDAITDKLSPLIFRIGSNRQVSSRCKSDLLKTFAAAQEDQVWAVKLLTASGFFPNGFLEWGLANLGSQDQCLRVYNPPDIRGQYCTLFWRPSTEYLVRRDRLLGHDKHPRLDTRLWLNNTRDRFHVGLRAGVCTPSTCSEVELNHLATAAFAIYGATASMRFCHVASRGGFSSLELGIIILFILMSLMVTIGTITEIALRFFGNGNEKSGGKIWRRFVLSYSVVSNTEKLLDVTPKTEEAERLRFLHGIKFFSTLWVILGHAYYCIQPDAVTSVFRAIEYTESFHFQVVANGFLAVSTFFFMSGFLLTYLTLKASQNRKKTNPGLQMAVMITRRYLRMTVPALVVVLALFLMPVCVRGPLAEEYFFKHYNGCLKNWWTVLLHTNNLNRFEDICMDHYWYISVDMQIFLIASVLCVVMTRNLRTGILALTALALVSTGGVAVQTFVKDYHPLILFWNPDTDKTTATAEQLYSLPFSHFGSFAIGMTTGVCVLKFYHYRINKWWQMFLWPMTVVLTAAVTFAPWKWNNLQLPPRSVASAYAALHKDVWAIALSWVTYACSTGRGGVVTRLLSWNAYVVPSRLTYSVYLIHYLVYLARMGVIAEPLQIHEFLQLKDFLGVAVLSYLLAFVLYLAVEAPIVNLEKIFLGRVTDDSEAHFQDARGTMREKHGPIRKASEAQQSKL
ncbi:nose resistant to fluoxetine protein 6-like [Ornithodoros turicata]|uniref:nose resistant to fluoxetine protein 6-like n=1 Tax=Ornithodoros turicata TaxID=34597 RepID=UPI003138994C